MPAHRLSVVVPTHNRSERLQRAAQSLLDQEAIEIEVVIVDDASSDDTPAVTDKLASDRRVRVVRNDVSLGPGGSRNRGMAAASGDLLGFCDDDDTWQAGAAAAVVDHLDGHPDVGAVSSWHRVVHDHSGRTAVFRGPLAYGSDQLLWFNCVALPFGVIRREMFPEDLVMDPTLPPCEDWDFWLRCAQLHPICTVPKVLYAYHQHGENRVTRAGSRDVEGRQRFVDKHSDSMSPACRRYHELVIAQMTDGRRGVAERLTADLSMPVASALAGSVLAIGALTSSVGVRRGDPGLSGRVTAALLRGRTHRVEPTRSHR